MRRSRPHPGGPARPARACALALAGALVAACGAQGPPAERTVPAEPGPGAVRAEATERLVDGAWVREGPYASWYADGARAAEGAFRAGRRSGAWRTWHADGAPASEGSYLFGRPEGVWIHRTPDGALDPAATGVYEDGERVDDWHEEGVRGGRLNNGLLQEATYAAGVRNGPARGFYPTGAPESEGRYADGLRTGPWTFWTPDGAVDAEQSGVYALHVKVAELDAAGGER